MAWTYPSTWRDLRHPWVRAALLAYLDELADPHETARWLQPPGDDVAGIDQTIHFFFDDHDYGDEPSLELGHSLLDPAEVAAVHAVTQAIDAILKRNRDGDDAYFPSHPLWGEVVDAARTAAALLREAGEPVWTGS